MPLDKQTINNPPKCNVKLKDILEADMKNVKKNMDLREKLELNNHG